MSSPPPLSSACSGFGGGGRGIVPPSHFGGRSTMNLRCGSCHLFISHRRRRGRALLPPPSRSGHDRRFLAPYCLERLKSKNGLHLHPHGVFYYLSTSTLMSQKNGDSVITCKGLCKILWTIEAGISEGYHIFLTGDPVALGCWEPSMAILLSPCKGKTNLWMTEIKVPYGIHFKYNYFIRKENFPSGDLIWRPGPEFSLSVTSLGAEKGVIVVKDCWLTYRLQGQPFPIWGSWMVNLDLPDYYLNERDSQVSSAGEPNIFRNLNGLPLSEKDSIICVPEEKSFDEDEKITACRSKEHLPEREQPVEEPWLFRSTLFSLSDASELDETFSQVEQSPRKTSRELHEVERATIEDEKNVTHLEEPASTVILINSSVCTMQRIAVLEDDKLVELLLEPVKNTVQCDSIYLGVVTKLVPHMGGAFVDIGISRPSLMDIKRNRQPFVYPPLHNEVEVDMDDCLSSVWAKEYSDNHEHHQSYDDDDDDDATNDLLEVDDQNDILQTKHCSIDEYEAEDDLDVSDATKINLNSETIDDGMQTHYGINGERIGVHVEDDDTEDFVPLETENNSDLPILLDESLRDSGLNPNRKNKWAHVREGTKIIVQVVKEGLGTKGPALTAYPNLRSRFWILITRCNRIGVSKKITGAERTRLKVIAKTLQPSGFGLTVRTVAAGHSIEELKKDLEGLLSTWKGIIEHAKSAALAAEEGVEGAVPFMLHRAMGQTLSVVQDYFNEKVKSMVVDSPRTFHEVTRYLQDIAPDLCNRVTLYEKRTPIFDEYNIEEEIDNILSKRVPLSNGGYLVIEQTEALVSIDVNGGHCMLGEGTSQEKAVLDVNLAAAKQIAREIRLRDIGGIIVVDFIDMADESNKRLVYEEMKKAVERDRSTVRVSELSRLGLMEITRKRVRPSVTFMISEPCTCCHATGRVEALETSFSKMEHEICRLLAVSDKKPDPENAKSWPRFVLRVDRYMCNYLTSGKRTRLAVLSSSLKVWILLKVARGFSRGSFEVKPFAAEEGKPDDQQQVAISRLSPTEAASYIPIPKLTLFPVKKWKGRPK